MTANKKRKQPHLGRGLQSLISPTTVPEKGLLSEVRQPSNFPPDPKLGLSLRLIPIKEIKPNPYQPRTVLDPDQLRDLSDSIRANGVIQPIIVRRTGDEYELIAGERRWRAAGEAGLDSIPALLREANDAELLELALVENIHRADLNPIERALAYKNYIDSFSLTQTEAAQRLGEDRSVVSNYIRLLDLPRDVKQMLIDGVLSMGHARAILSLPTEDLRRKLANRAMAGRLSVRDVERLVRLLLQTPADTTLIKPPKPSHIADLEKRLREILSTKVTINTIRSGRRGKIIIEFYSLDEFDRLTEEIGLGAPEKI